MFNSTVIHQLPAAFAAVDVSGARYSTMAWTTGILSGLLQLSFLWKTLVVLFLLSNAKNLPFVYHLRLINAFRFVLHSLRPEKPVSPDQLFQPLITSSHVPITEIDLYMHKSNSTYFTDIDVARTHLICTLFARGIEKVRGGTSSLVGGKASNFAVALGAVSCSFRKELKPYEHYDLHTRVLTWDDKWMYVVTHFVKKGAVLPATCTLYPQQARSMSTSKSPKVAPELDKAVVASALSKLVFKKGRITIAPEVMLEASGLLPEKVDEIQLFKDYDALNTPQISGQEKKDVIAIPTKITVPVRNDNNDGEHDEQISRSSSRTTSVSSSAASSEDRRRSLSAESSTTSPLGSDCDDESIDPLTTTTNTTSKQQQQRRSPTTQIPNPSPSPYWTRTRIDHERRKGLEKASLLALQADLANDLRPNTDALGYHTDATGVQGIISTLAQLGYVTRRSSL